MAWPKGHLKLFSCCQIKFALPENYTRWIEAFMKVKGALLDRVGFISYDRALCLCWSSAEKDGSYSYLKHTPAGSKAVKDTVWKCSSEEICHAQIDFFSLRKTRAGLQITMRLCSDGILFHLPNVAFPDIFHALCHLSHNVKAASRNLVDVYCSFPC